MSHPPSNLSALFCTCVQPPCHDFFGTSIALLDWFLSQHALLQQPHPCIELFHYIYTCNKLFQLVIQIQYHLKVIYNLGGVSTDTQTHWHRRQKQFQETRHAPDLKIMKYLASVTWTKVPIRSASAPHREIKWHLVCKSYTLENGCVFIDSKLNVKGGALNVSTC